MPIFVGGVWENGHHDAESAIERLCKNFSPLIGSDCTCYVGPSCKILAGKHKAEGPNQALHSLENNAGLIVGSFFHKDPDAPLVRAFLSPAETEAILCSQGEWLAQNRWGRYILFLLNKQKDLFIFRDPLGLSSLFYVKISGGMLFPSDIHPLKEAIGKNLPLDWEYLVSSVACGSWVTNRMAFQTIYEAYPGHFLSLKNSNLHLQSFWNPTTIPLSDVSSQDIERRIMNTFLHNVSQ